MWLVFFKQIRNTNIRSHLLIECMIIFRGLVAIYFLLSQAGAQVSINQSPDYNHPQTGGSPVYYSSRCSVSVSVSELGEGTHSFQGKIYPGVKGGQNLVNAIEPTKTVSLCESLLFILINFSYSRWNFLPPTE